MIQAVHTLIAKGIQLEEEYVDYIAEENIFAVVDVEYGQKTDKGKHFLNDLRNQFVNTSTLSLNEVEIKLDSLIKKHNLPSNFSIVFAFKKNDGVYLKTYGEGYVYIIRGGTEAKLVDKNQSASGRLHEKDILIFTNYCFENLSDYINKSAIQISEDIHKIFQNDLYKGRIALICDFVQEEKFNENITKPVELPEALAVATDDQAQPIKDGVIEKIKQLYLKSRLAAGSTPTGKKITFIIICILLVIFVWSVVLGYGRRSEAENQKRIDLTRNLISQKLNQINDVAYLNMPKAMSLIDEVKNEIVKLKKDLGDKKEIKPLEELIKQKEDSIIKKEDKKYLEFYDLSIDNKQAKGDRMALSGESVAILDRSQGNIYVLSLTKKSLNKYSFPEIKQASTVSIYDEQPFFFTDKGIYKIDGNGKIIQLIESDKEWGQIIDMAIYNGNIYLLDKEKDEVYKYLVAENGYSNKSSYFKSGQAIKLSDVTSLTIDSSIYISLANDIFKYTAGSRDNFETTYPEGNISIAKVYSNKDLEKVFVWNKIKGSIYVLSKEGTYEREITTSIAQQANDIVVFNEAAYILKGQKIYSVDLR